MWNQKKKGTNELIFKTEDDSQIKGGEGYVRRMALTYTHYYI